jgi:hypothetical protein
VEPCLWFLSCNRWIDVGTDAWRERLAAGALLTLERAVI